MSEHFQLKDDVLTLGQEMGVTQVTELYEALSASLESGCEKLTIDSSALKRVDGAFLQLMAGFVAEMTNENHAVVEWLAPPEILASAAKTLDLGEVLNLH